MAAITNLKLRAAFAASLVSAAAAVFVPVSLGRPRPPGSQAGPAQAGTGNGTAP